MTSDEKEAEVEIKPNEPIKIQLGAQIDGFGSIVCDTVLATGKDSKDVVEGRDADLMLEPQFLEARQAHFGVQFYKQSNRSCFPTSKFFSA